MNSLADSMQCHGDSIRCYGAWHLMPGGKTSDPDFVRRDVANAPVPMPAAAGTGRAACILLRAAQQTVPGGQTARHKKGGGGMYLPFRPRARLTSVRLAKPGIYFTNLSVSVFSPPSTTT